MSEQKMWALRRRSDKVLRLVSSDKEEEETFVSHYVHTSQSNMDVISCIYDPNGNALTYAQLCDLINELQDDCQSLKGALENIVEARNAFDGPSLDYMQGYRDGQQYLQERAKLGLSQLEGP